jgi:outer membrane biosynthesis protein TonB
MNGSSERGTAGIDPTDLVVAEPALEEVARTHLEEELDIEREARAFLDATVQEITEVQIEEPPTQVEEAPGPEVIAEAIDLAPEAEATEAVPVAEPVIEEIEQTAPEPEPVAVAKPEPIVEAPQTEPQETVAVAPARNGRHAADLPSPLGDEDAADLVEEVERILQVKRWDKRKNPFRGFDSPPGRF